MRRVFRFTPTELRAKRRKSDPIDVDGGIGLRVPLAIPAEPATVLSGLADVAVVGVEAVSQGCYRRVVGVAGHPGAVAVRYQDAATLVVEAHLPRFDRLIEVVSRIRHIFTTTSNGACGVQGWTGPETAVKRLLVSELGPSDARAILGTLAQRHGVDLAPLRPLGRTHANADYEALSETDWIRAGLTPDLATRCLAASRSPKCLVVDRPEDGWNAGRLDDIVTIVHEDLVGHAGAARFGLEDLLEFRRMIAGRFRDSASGHDRPSHRTTEWRSYGRHGRPPGTPTTRRSGKGSRSIECKTKGSPRSEGGTRAASCRHPEHHWHRLSPSSSRLRSCWPSRASSWCWTGLGGLI